MCIKLKLDVSRKVVYKTICKIVKETKASGKKLITFTEFTKRFKKHFANFETDDIIRVTFENYDVKRREYLTLDQFQELVTELDV